MSEKSAAQVVVVGAGIVGVSTGVWLARAGFNVVLVDRLDPGEGTSHGNGGVLASCAMVPVTGPGLRRKAPGLLLDKDSPLFMRWSYLPRLAPWLWRYLGYANDSDTRRIAQHLAYITGDSLEQHQDLGGNTEADKWLVPSDYQFAYRSRAEFDADSYAWSLRHQHGFTPEILTGPLVREKEPALAESINLLAVVKEHGHITSPGLYVKSLARVFQALGGTIVKAAVKDFEMSSGRVSAVVLEHGKLVCDHAVIATGVWSKTLSERFGLKIPLESERGYHVIFKDAINSLSTPTMVASGKFVATPMNDGLRCAGIVELGGLDAGPSQAPIDLLMRHVNRTLPQLSYSETVEWLGHRPAPADSLPFIGQVGQTGVYTGFGHHHIGLTGGAKTGRLIADLISNQHVSGNLHPFRPDRFT